jgi:hypothetical protein
VSSSSIFLAVDWHPVEHNTVKGFFSLVLPSQMVLRSCSLHVRDGQRWVSPPGRRSNNGSYEMLIDFASKDARDRWQRLALDAVDELLKGERP